MVLINSIALIIATFYLFQINIFRDGWKRLPHTTTDKREVSTTVTVIIPFKNEINNLPKLIESLQNQSYNKFQVIFVDDHSDDGSFDYLHTITQNSNQFSLLKNSGKGKKEAIKTAIYNTQSELIVTLDADVSLTQHWLLSILQFYEQEQAELIICPIRMSSSSKNFVERFQQFEFAILVASGAGAAGAGMPILCNGANLAFKRDAWLDSENEMHFEEPSGDDIYLLQSIKKRKEKIVFLHSDDALAETEAKKSWRELLLQRSRWVSKFSIYKDLQLLFTALTVSAMSGIILFCFVLYLFNPLFFYSFVLSFILKYLVDVLFFNDIKSFFGLKRVYLQAFIFSLVYPLYIVATLIFTPFRKKAW